MALTSSLQAASDNATSAARTSKTLSDELEKVRNEKADEQKEVLRQMRQLAEQVTANLGHANAAASSAKASADAASSSAADAFHQKNTAAKVVVELLHRKEEVTALVDEAQKAQSHLHRDLTTFITGAIKKAIDEKAKALAPPRSTSPPATAAPTITINNGPPTSSS